MKTPITLFLLLPITLATAQSSELRNLKLGVQVGRSQAHIAESATVSGMTGITVPLFHTMLNQFGVTASLGSQSFPKFTYRLGLGYQSLETAYTNDINRIIDGYTVPVVYVKPGMGFGIPLGDRWKVIPYVDAAFNLNIDESLTFEEWSVQYKTERYFITLNPGIELQMHADGAWYLSAYAEYQYGFSPVVTSYNPSPRETAQIWSTHNGTAVNFGLKLSYCLPCRE